MNKFLLSLFSVFGFLCASPVAKAADGKRFPYVGVWTSNSKDADIGRVEFTKNGYCVLDNWADMKARLQYKMVGNRALLQYNYDEPNGEEGGSVIRAYDTIEITPLENGLKLAFRYTRRYSIVAKTNQKIDNKIDNKTASFIMRSSWHTSLAQLSNSAGMAQGKPASRSAQSAMNGLISAVKIKNIKVILGYIPSSGLKVKETLVSPPTYETWKPGDQNERKSIVWFFTGTDNVNGTLGDSLREAKWVQVGRNRFARKGGNAKNFYMQWRQHSSKWLITEIGWHFP